MRVTCVSEQMIGSEQPVGSTLCFLVTPQAPVRLPRLRNHHLCHYYRGNQLELLLKLDGSSEKIVIGQRRWFRGGSTEWPGVVPADVELGDAETLAKDYLAVAAEIRCFLQSAT